ncbi:TRAP-type C4-dicarboxylate transport system, small permease component [Palleronia marisminoris]|uniref:TRAP transporter small permease protein n=1 Tax=Palleronia marisminoris TaxID=315423 RepID=A0A1Y5SBN7_9RHOB|nr:TRAP transporter small permease [Palleronia marisminoris]SFG67222.1 TRAP-type C4-dicarboxylate transport system, small permease component [Palleronia marisminoris]SLN34306.1 Tripartite ATP-independent periplasmic transporters, DctQ component [Palleronia marisminoris]
MIRIITGGLEIFSGLLLVALMLVTGIDVVGRYLFDTPLPGAFETTELMLGALVFAALPLVSRAGSHVEVDILATLLPERIGTRLLWLASVIAAGVLLVFALRLLALGLQQAEDGTRSISLGIPFAPIAIFGALSCLVAAIFGFLRVAGR